MLNVGLFVVRTIKSFWLLYLLFFGVFVANVLLMPTPPTGATALIVVAKVAAMALGVSILLTLALLAHMLWKSGTSPSKFLRMKPAQARELF
jgi:Ni,Fe-hydrogenase I cytochrome b subunit